MAYKLFPLGTIPFIANGNPATGYKVYTYQTGTTTPRTSYTDATGAVANANPVIFDQYGLKQIWLKDDINYKLVVKSSDDVTTYITLDNVGGVSDSLSISATQYITTIIDSSGNEVETFAGVTGAVNYTEISNSITAVKPKITFKGDDTNVSGEITTQGAGQLYLTTPTVNCSSNLAVTTNATVGGTLGVTGATTFASSCYYTSVITPAAITSNQNNYNPTGMDTAHTVRLSSDAARTITGINAGTSGRKIVLQNVGSFTISLSVESASSTAANRILGFGTSVDIPSNTSLSLDYDATSSRWRLVGYATPIAVQADMEAETSSVTFVSPAILKSAPRVAKAFVTWDSGYNVVAFNGITALTNNAAGDNTITFSGAFSSVNYCAVGGNMGLNLLDSGVMIAPYASNPTTTTFRIATTRWSTGVLIGPVLSDIVFFGDK